MFIDQKDEFRWRRIKKNGREISCCKHILFGFVFSVAVATSPSLVASPAGGDVVNGAAGIIYSGPDTTINQSTQRVDINWQGFNTAVNESVTFNQPTNLAVAVNRVVTGGETQFLGALNANGRVFLINNAGIYFGQSAQVNVGALIATTSDLDDFGQATQEVNNFSFTGSDNWAKIQNDGSINIAPGGFALLAAPYVENNGTIQSDAGVVDTDGAEGYATAYYEGQVELLSGKDFTVASEERGNGFLTAADMPETWDGGEGGDLAVTNTGTLRSRSGNVYITANMARNVLLEQTVNLDGIIDADAFAPGDDGGTIMIASATDIKFTDLNSDGVGADIHAIGGETAEAAFIANGNIESTDDTRATIKVQANGEGDWRWDTSADANLAMDAGTGGSGDIDIKADIIVKATAAVQDDSNSVDTAAAARANLNAQGGVKIAGNINVEANATSAPPDGDYGRDASADAVLQVDAQGSIDIEGAVMVKARAEGGSYYDDADAYARADFDARNDVYLDDVEVQATAINMNSSENGYDATAEAYLLVDAGEEEIDGSIEINGDVLVQADADLNGTDTASATASANLTATRDITIITDATTFRVKADAYHSGTDDDADADAYFYAGAGGALDITGNVEVTANAESRSYEVTANAESRSYDATADAYVDLYGEAVNIEGDITVDATAVSDGYSADADAELNIAAEGVGKAVDSGNLTITGNINVSADATLGTMATDTANAHVHVDLDAARDLTVTGDTVVTATADNQGTQDNATADADLHVNAGNSGPGSLTMGDVTVEANATRGTQGEEGDDSDTHVDVDVDLYASNNVTAGNVRAAAISANKAGSADGADAEADLDVYAGAFDGAEGGSVNLAQVEVIAQATNADEGYTDPGTYADASLAINAQDSVTVTGSTVVTASADATTVSTVNADAQAEIGADTGAINMGSAQVEATAYARGEGAMGATSDADIDLYAAQDVTVTGSTQVVSAATTDSLPSAAVDAHAGLYAVSGADDGGSGNLNMRSVNVVADAETHGAEADAYAEAVLEAGSDVSIAGNIETRATASAVDNMTSSGSDSDYAWGYGAADAVADLDVTAGLSENEEVSQLSDVNITGNITVASTATVASADTDGIAGSAMASAQADASISAPNDVTVAGDVNVTAKADSAIALSDKSEAIAALSMVAGSNQFPDLIDLLNDRKKPKEPSLYDDIEMNPGRLTYTGDITVRADADTKSELSGTADAFAVAWLLGGGDVEINTDPVRVFANADVETGNPDMFDGGEGGAMAGAVLGIAAGLAFEEEPANLVINGDVSAQAHANHPDPGWRRSWPSPLMTSSIYGMPPEGYPEGEAALAGTFLTATGDITIVGADPLAGADTAPNPAPNKAFVQGQETAHQDCADGSCSGVEPGFTPFEFGEGSTSIAQLVIEAGGEVSITPDTSKDTPPSTPEDIAVQAALEGQSQVEMGFLENLPLRFDSQGNMFAATGIGETKPLPFDEDFERRLLAGGDPSKLLPATAAGRKSEGGNAAKGEDFCALLVSGGCLK